MILETFVARHLSRRGRLLAAVLLAIVVVAGLLWGFSGGARQRTLRAVQACVDPLIDGSQSLGAVFNTHPHLADPRWTAGWSDDDRLVAVEAQVARFDDLRQGLPHLVAPFLVQIAAMPQWAGIAGDQPATVQVVFQASTGGDGALTVQVASVRLTEAWVVFQPAAVENYEKSIETAIANADDRRRARRYRLRHDGDRALFNVGLDGPMIAGAGLRLAAPAACAALAGWR